MSELFDFGFTAVDEQELEAVQQATATAKAVESTATTTQDRLDKLYNAVVPLLNNLKKNPEKDYIYWPNRYEKLDAFADKLHQILSGE